MKRRKTLQGTAFITLALILLAPTALEAQGYGCWICEEGAVGMFGPSEWQCEQVGNEEHGDGIRCREFWTVIGTNCVVDLGPCFNVNAPGEGPPEEESQG